MESDVVTGIKVIFVSTHDEGSGAANSCQRIFQAVRSVGINAEMLVQWKLGTGDTIYSCSDNFWKKQCTRIRYRFERYRAKKCQEVWYRYFSFGDCSPKDSIEYINSSDADIVHLHWINAGFLSIQDIGKINKPIVWSLHDMWPFTGGCHYAGDCEAYASHCGNCPIMRVPGSNDVSRKIFQNKLQNFPKSIWLVGSSNWITKKAKKSSLFDSDRITSIPTPVTPPTRKIAKEQARKMLSLPANKKLILFGAQNVADPRKGFEQLISALKLLDESDAELVLFGRDLDMKMDGVLMKCNSLGLIGEPKTLNYLYTACDVLVVPSLEENLSNVILEGLSHGCPVVCFDIGGNSDMIEHGVNGSLVSITNEGNSMHNEIRKWLVASDAQRCSVKLGVQFKPESVGAQYHILYRRIISQKD